MSVTYRTLAYIQPYQKPFIRSCEEPVGRWYAYTNGNGDGSGGDAILQIEISATGTIYTGDCYYDVQSYKWSCDAGLGGTGYLTISAISSERLHAAESWNLIETHMNVFYRVPSSIQANMGNNPFNGAKFKMASGYGIYSGMEAVATPNGATGFGFGATGFIYDMSGGSIPIVK